ncbi:MAG TPA: hypothetical protein VMJ10_19975 [Kofleriaceae bacterium]|nr:hypothetical protein [Kofleriaceae bacterium]
MRRIPVALVLLAAPAAAETFAGFSGVDKPYLVDVDRVCAPLAVTDAKATGMPRCAKQDADAIAALRVKKPIEQRGAKATFAATATGTTVTITRGGDVVVTWDAPDPVEKIVAVYGSEYEDRVAIAYVVRRLGREVTDVVGFELIGSAKTTTTTTTTTTNPGTTTTVDDAAVAKAVATAKRAGAAHALKAWHDVLALDAQHGEALYRVAVLEASKQRADAVATLGKLAASTRADAVEWLVEARFDVAFAPLRADPKFREAVGLDRKPQTPYEHVMGFGGQWEQAGTSCEVATVHVTFARDRAVQLHVRSSCEGGGDDLVFKGTWRLDGDHVVLSLPHKGQKASAKDEAHCDIVPAGDEDSLHCSLGNDLDFTVLPTRR